jgi:hypothetical protein
MDRAGRIAKRIAAGVWRGIRRWPKTTFFVLAPVVLLVVPVWPFFPSCGIGTYTVRDNHIYRYMSDDYRTVLKSYFRHYGIYYWDIGGVVFVRALPFLDCAPIFYQGAGVMTYGDGIANAESKAAAALSIASFVGSYEGHELNGRIYRAPSFIRELVANHSSKWPYDRCDVMPYIVTMTPPAKAER